MSKVTVQFEIETSRIPELEAFLNGDGQTKRKSKAAADDVFSSAESEESDLDFDSEDVEPEVTKKMLLDAVKDRVSAKKTAALTKLFTHYKVKNVSGINEEKYEQFYKDLLKIKV